MFVIQSSVIGALACSDSVTAAVRNRGPLPCSGDSRIVAPIPRWVDLQHSSTAMLLSLAHSIVAGLFRYQALRSPPVTVFTTLVPPVTFGRTAHLVFALRVSRRVSLACAPGRG